MFNDSRIKKLKKQIRVAERIAAKLPKLYEQLAEADQKQRLYLKRKQEWERKHLG
jgi:hypothetical protein